jgi:hypothetical protein
MDDTDDWMNPRTSISFTMPPPKNGRFYRIERKRATPVSGNVSAIYSWDLWREYENEDERDAELAQLREQHPMWQLRGRRAFYINGENREPNPTEHMDF